MDYNYKYDTEMDAINSHYLYGINWDFELAKLQVKRLENTGEPQKKFVARTLNEFTDSPTFETMRIAEQYLMNENVTISNRERPALGVAGTVSQHPLLANTKLKHPFMYNLVEQKVNFLLSREMSIESSNRDYATKISEYFDKSFHRQLKTLGQSAVPFGIAWLQVYYNSSGELKFKHIPSHEVIPFWRDSEHRELDAVVRYYVVNVYNDEGIPREVTKIEYYTDEGVWYYEKDENGISVDPKHSVYPQPNFFVNVEDTELKQVQDTDEEIEEFPTMWSKIPFVAFKYNHYEVSLLQWVRSLIDEYDQITSELSNNIKDFPNSFKVVKGYSGEDEDAFNVRLATSRTAFLTSDEGSDMKVLTMPLDYEGVRTVSERLRKDIYDGGKGLDPQEANFGHASGVAIRYRYLGLVQDCMAMGNEFQEALEKLLYFINIDIRMKGGEDYSKERVDFIFNTDAIMNETETITNIRNSVGIISDETLVAMHPYTTDAQAEFERLKLQREEQMKQFGTDDPLGTGNREFGSDMTAEAFLEAESKGTGLDIKKRG